MSQQNVRVVATPLQFSANRQGLKPVVNAVSHEKNLLVKFRGCYESSYSIPSGYLT